MFLFSWLKSGLNAGTMLTIVTLASGLIAAHGRDRERMDELDRRMAVAEQNSVKRAEMDARDKSLTEILQSIDTRLATIERALMEGKRN
jgi:hypothetical protein